MFGFNFFNWFDRDILGISFWLKIEEAKQQNSATMFEIAKNNKVQGHFFEANYFFALLIIIRTIRPFLESSEL